MDGDTPHSIGEPVRRASLTVKAIRFHSDREIVTPTALKGVASGKPSAEVGYWTAVHACGRSVAPRALEALTGGAFATFGNGGLAQLELLHQVDNSVSCRVAQKSRYAFDRILLAAPPAFPPRRPSAHPAQGRL